MHGFTDFGRVLFEYVFVVVALIVFLSVFDAVVLLAAKPNDTTEGDFRQWSFSIQGRALTMVGLTLAVLGFFTTTSLSQIQRESLIVLLLSAAFFFISYQFGKFAREQAYWFEIQRSYLDYGFLIFGFGLGHPLSNDPHVVPTPIIAFPLFLALLLESYTSAAKYNATVG
jgi:hypothetical protein